METMNTRNHMVTVHTPVLLQEVIDVLALNPDDIVVDGTLGGAGHAKAILDTLGPNGTYLGIDADKGAIERAHQLIGDDPRYHTALGNYRNIDLYVKNAQLPRVDKVLLDLGLSSDQLHQDDNRGFSFQNDEPLKMTYSALPQKETVTAWHVVNEWSESSLQDIIFGFGGERHARRIAHAIVEAREEKPIQTSKRLAEVVATAVHRKSHIHPATKTFQAIRMAVNDELGALEEVLQKAIQLLTPEGRIAVISFHSLEDRIVKRTFRTWEETGLGKRITKRPIVPKREESNANKRARSAKLRCFETADIIHKERIEP
jgi:16S rRNA (cytosine1402-N4)-methyltransferase